MEMYFNSRAMARNIKAGKLVDNGTNSIKRWGRQVEAKPTKKEQLTLKCTKDWRYPENAKPVNVQIKKSKI